MTDQEVNDSLGELYNNSNQTELIKKMAMLMIVYAQQEPEFSYNVAIKGVGQVTVTLESK